MAQTNFAKNDALVAKVWSSRVWKQIRDRLFWTRNGLLGGDITDSDSVVHYVNEMTSVPGKGTVVVMPLVEELREDGVVGDNVLEGQDEELITDDQEIRLDCLRNAVKSKGRYSEAQTVLRFRTEARGKLANWGVDRLDELYFLTCTGVDYTLRLNGAARPGHSQFPGLKFASDVVAPSTNRVVYGGAATSTATIVVGDVMTWDLLVGAKAKAVRERLKPLRRRGMNHYIVVMTPEQARDLRRNSDYKDLTAKGQVRGDSNPLFAGTFANVDGLLLFEHNRVYNTIGAAAGSKWGATGVLDGATALMLGAQAMGFARIGDFTWAESDNTDYKNKQAIAFGGMFGLLKPQWVSQPDRGNVKEDFGVIVIRTAAKV